MSRRPSTLRSSKLARLFLCVLFVFQSGAALAAPPRVRPEPSATAFTPTPTQAPLPTPRSKQLAAHAGNICQQSHCAFLPYLTSGGGQLPSRPTEPTPEPTEP